MRKTQRVFLAGSAVGAILMAGAVIRSEAVLASPFGNPTLDGRLPTPQPANIAPSPPRDTSSAPDAFREPSAATTRSRTPAAGPQRLATPEPAGRAQTADEPVQPRFQTPRPASRPTAAPGATPLPAPVPARAAAPQAPAPTTAVATSTTTAPAADVGDALRQAIADKSRIERLIPRADDRAAIVAHYEKNSFVSLWFVGGAQNERALAATAHLQTVDADGLDPADYALPQGGNGPQSLADAELRFTATLLTYARHAMDGRVHWSRVAKDIDYKAAFDAANVLRQIATAADLSRTLAGFNPPHAGYRALKAKYQELRDAPASEDEARIASGPALRITRDRQGRTVMPNDPRVPVLRERLGLKPESNSTYNVALANAVGQFQRARGMRATGALDAATLAALNPPSRAQQIETVRANLERWRWVPRDFGRLHVALNIPDYHLRVMNNGQQVWMTRVVVGKPNQPTPLISDTMRYITVNPIWHPPQSIIYQELMPAFESGDRGIFERQGLRVERRENGEIRVFQPPGDRNALGRLRFNFPNKFLVYMHDTPEKHYFAHPRRAYSHGCMRVQDPLKYAEVLLSLGAPRGNFTQENIRRMYGDQERQLDFQTPIQVHLTYQTAFVDEAGKLQFREDIYGIDKALLEQLEGDNRKVADLVYERPADPNYQPKPEERQRLQGLARNSAPNPFALLEQLFR